MATHPHAPPHDPTAAAARWAKYLQERFPPAQYAVALGSFTWAAMAYARALAGEPGLAPAFPFFAALAVTLLVFLQLRILDEFKDAEEDARYRPERPLPRGLVTRAGLLNLWIAACAVEIALAATLGFAPLLWLLLAMGYSGLMRVEFFARDWLRAHPLAYLASHMVIVPLIALFVFSSAGAPFAPPAAFPFLGFSFLSFCVFELGRKTWAPNEERPGVETYSALWGVPRALLAWMTAMAGAAIAGGIAALQVGIALAYAPGAAIVLIAAAAVGARFGLHPERARGRNVLAMSAAWFVGMHLAFGAALALGLRAPA